MNETHPDKVKILFQEETGERKLNAFSWRYEEQPRAVQIGRVVVGKTRWCDVSGLAGQNVVASGSRISSQIGRKVPIRRRQLNGQQNDRNELHFQWSRAKLREIVGFLLTSFHKCNVYHAVILSGIVYLTVPWGTHRLFRLTSLFDVQCLHKYLPLDGSAI